MGFIGFLVLGGPTLSSPVVTWQVTALGYSNARALVAQRAGPMYSYIGAGKDLWSRGHSPRHLIRSPFEAGDSYIPPRVLQNSGRRLVAACDYVGGNGKVYPGA